jgi:hypothetical protein
MTFFQPSLHPPFPVFRLAMLSFLVAVDTASWRRIASRIPRIRHLVHSGAQAPICRGFLSRPSEEDWGQAVPPHSGLAMASGRVAQPKRLPGNKIRSGSRHNCGRGEQ